MVTDSDQGHIEVEPLRHRADRLVIRCLWHCPQASMDLLLVTLAWMYEQDRDMNFWHLDELIRDELTPTMLQFQQGLHKVLKADA